MKLARSSSVKNDTPRKCWRSSACWNRRRLESSPAVREEDPDGSVTKQQVGELQLVV